MKIYFAGPLFTEAERAWVLSTKKKMETLARELKKDVTVIWPYELITQEEIEALGPQAKLEIFRRCREQLQDTDLLIALLDGTQVDDGTAWEIGYFYARRSERSKIIGVRTDFRRAGEADGSIVNAMIECSCDEIAMSGDELLEILQATFVSHE